jgi:hypothetical protein
MCKNRLYQGHSVSNFLDSFSYQLETFGLRQRATKNIKHKPSKGAERELSLREFFGHLLPIQYEAATGEWLIYLRYIALKWTS